IRQQKHSQCIVFNCLFISNWLIFKQKSVSLTPDHCVNGWNGTKRRVLLPKTCKNCFLKNIRQQKHSQYIVFNCLPISD
ncbi:hypothetical protein, partial [Rheinheimera riviphila]|uniref:hypothetical protein n=1 Tax=Rheinheimera riviphila TaxID=1834037 RepID=UPI00197D4F8E